MPEQMLTAKTGLAEVPDLMAMAEVAVLPKDVAAQSLPGGDGVTRADHVHRGVGGLVIGDVNLYGMVELLSGAGLQISADETTKELTVTIVADITTVTSAYTIGGTDYVILCDTNDGAFTVTLPPVADQTGRIYYIKNIGTASNDVTVTGTIDGDATQAVIDGNCLVVVCDGTEWWVI